MTELNLKEIGSRLIAIRTTLKLSQLDISQQCDIDRTYVSRIENGKIQPSFDVLWRLSSAYDVSIDWIIWGSGTMLKKDSEVIICGINEMNKDNILKLLSYSRETQNRLFKIFSEIVGISNEIHTKPE